MDADATTITALHLWFIYILFLVFHHSRVGVAKVHSSTPSLDHSDSSCSSDDIGDTNDFGRAPPEEAFAVAPLPADDASLPLPPSSPSSSPSLPMPLPLWRRAAAWVDEREFVLAIIAFVIFNLTCVVAFTVTGAAFLIENDEADFIYLARVCGMIALVFNIIQWTPQIVLTLRNGHIGSLSVRSRCHHTLSPILSLSLSLSLSPTLSRSLCHSHVLELSVTLLQCTNCR